MYVSKVLAFKSSWKLKAGHGKQGLIYANQALKTNTKRNQETNVETEA
jgi:hypothetical protein